MINQQALQVLEEEVLSLRRCMTSCRESREEAATLTTLLTTRKTLNIGEIGDFYANYITRDRLTCWRI